MLEQSKYPLNLSELGLYITSTVNAEKTTRNFGIFADNQTILNYLETHLNKTKFLLGFEIKELSDKDFCDKSGKNLITRFKNANSQEFHLILMELISKQRCYIRASDDDFKLEVDRTLHKYINITKNHMIVYYSINCSANIFFSAITRKLSNILSMSINSVGVHYYDAKKYGLDNIDPTPPLSDNTLIKVRASIELFKKEINLTPTIFNNDRKRFAVDTQIKNSLRP